jgi:predicted molibdopterin-dependent oxidoreductase YjgC
MESASEFLCGELHRQEGKSMKRQNMRLTEPMIRENGRLRPASWDEAIHQVAAGFGAAKARGPHSFGIFSCSKASNEMNYAAQKFARQVMGTNNIDSCNRT